jgi:hypothetical protein
MINKKKSIARNLTYTYVFRQGEKNSSICEFFRNQHTQIHTTNKRASGPDSITDMVIIWVGDTPPSLSINVQQSGCFLCLLTEVL